jgi:hypothetical protein
LAKPIGLAVSEKELGIVTGRVNPRPVRVGYWRVRVRVDIPLPVTNPYPGRGFSRVRGYQYNAYVTIVMQREVTVLRLFHTIVHILGYVIIVIIPFTFCC